jgi:hypothetical protein
VEAPAWWQGLAPSPKLSLSVCRLSSTIEVPQGRAPDRLAALTGHCRLALRHIETTTTASQARRQAKRHLAGLRSGRDDKLA